ncbi:MAG: carboxypeptidase regulatory-like domain-containing protein, partial [Bacteroidota bacterium]
MPFYRLLALSLVLASSAAAQVTVSGVVQDSTEAPLPGATVVLLTPADSVLVSFAASRSDGAFQLRNVREGEYLLRVTFVGYETASVPVTVQTEDLDVGTVRLATADGDLGRLLVETDRVPVILR